MTEAVLTNIEDGVITMTINRPEAKNAVTKQVAEEMAAALDELDGNDDFARWYYYWRGWNILFWYGS